MQMWNSKWTNLLVRLILQTAYPKMVFYEDADKKVEVDTYFLGIMTLRETKQLV